MQEEKWKFGRFEEPQGTMNYYREKQRLSWQFFIRVSMMWMTPCVNCQARFDGLLHTETRRFFEENPQLPQKMFNYLCGLCKGRAYKIVKNGTLILGNKEYVPALEFARKWITIKETMTKVTKEDYIQMRHRNT